MEALGEKAPQPDKEGLCFAVSRILGEGCAISQGEITQLGEKYYGVRSSVSLNLFYSPEWKKVVKENASSEDMEVQWRRRDYKGNKVYVDDNRELIPEELNKTYRRIDKRLSKKAKPKTKT